jgi:DNA-directed RNA polymerase specialized sigma24 family protein
MKKKKYHKFKSNEITRSNFQWILDTFKTSINQFVFRFTKIKRGDFDQEDIRQEIAVIVLESIDNWDASIGVQFSTHLFNKLNWSLLEYVRARTPFYKEGGKRRFYPTCLNIDNEEVLNLPSNEMEQLNDYNELVVTINSIENDITREVAQMRFLDEMSIENIKFLTNFDKGEIMNRLKEAKDFIAQEYLIDRKR